VFPPRLLDWQRPQPNQVSVRAREDDRAIPPLEPLHVARPYRASHHARHNLLLLKQEPVKGNQREDDHQRQRPPALTLAGFGRFGILVDFYVDEIEYMFYNLIQENYHEKSDGA